MSLVAARPAGISRFALTSTISARASRARPRPSRPVPVVLFLETAMIPAAERRPSLTRRSRSGRRAWPDRRPGCARRRTAVTGCWPRARPGLPEVAAGFPTLPAPAGRPPRMRRPAQHDRQKPRAPGFRERRRPRGDVPTMWSFERSEGREKYRWTISGAEAGVRSVRRGGRRGCGVAPGTRSSRQPPARPRSRFPRHPPVTAASGPAAFSVLQKHERFRPRLLLIRLAQASSSHCEKRPSRRHAPVAVATTGSRLVLLSATSAMSCARRLRTLARNQDWSGTRAPRAQGARRARGNLRACEVQPNSMEGLKEVGPAVAEDVTVFRSTRGIVLAGQAVDWCPRDAWDEADSGAPAPPDPVAPFRGDR